MKLTDADNAADGIFFPALEQNMMGAVLINENDEVMFFNPAAEKLWGYKREEVIGNNIDMLIPRDLRPAHPEYIRHNREGGKARVEGMSRELQLEKKDGSKIWTRFALSKVSAEGKVYYLALVRDASVEMAQKEQTRQLIIAVDHLDRPVIVLDPERHIVQCNRAFTEMFGYCISEASGMQPDTLLNIPEFPADNRIRLQQLLWKTARDQDEFLLLTRTGEKIWIKASISPVYDVLAHLQNLVMTFSDITEERQIRQLEGNILAAMCSSPPFHEMGEIICRNIESVLNESHVSLFALRNGMPIHWASSSHGAEIQNAQSWSATIRQRDGAPAGILQIKTSSGAETSAFIERVADISQHMAALALEQEKSRQHIEQLIQFDPIKGSTLGASGPQYVMVPKKHADQLRESLASGEIAAVQSTLVADNTPLNSRVYTVRSGDTLSSIASRLGVSTKDLQQWNKLRGSKLKPGQSLTIGAGSSAQRLANNSDSITYRVRKGDSLSSIAKRHGVNIKDVMRWNSDTANLQPGDKLTLFVKNNNMPDS